MYGIDLDFVFPDWLSSTNPEFVFGGNKLGFSFSFTQHTHLSGKSAVNEHSNKQRFACKETQNSGYLTRVPMYSKMTNYEDI